MTSVNVSSTINTVVVADANGSTVVQVPVVSAIAAITQGPQGPIGPAGPAGVNYTHQQLVAASIWTINHNLGFKPAVELLNSGSQEIEGDVIHASLNQTIVSFTSQVAGTARLN